MQKPLGLYRIPSFLRDFHICFSFAKAQYLLISPWHPTSPALGGLLLVDRKQVETPRVCSSKSLKKEKRFKNGPWKNDPSDPIGPSKKTMDKNPSIGEIGLESRVRGRKPEVCCLHISWICWVFKLCFFFSTCNAFFVKNYECMFFLLF